MARRPQNLDLSGLHASIGENGRLTPHRPNFHMDLPSPRAGEVPPALSPLDAFALHSRTLARKLEQSAKSGKRMSRLPHHEIQTELAKRPEYFRSVSAESEAFSDTTEDRNDEADNEELRGQPQITTKEYRPVSQHPYHGNMANEKDRPISNTKDGLVVPQSSRRNDNEDHGYFGIEVPRSSSPEPFDGHNSKAGGISPALPSLTSSIDSIGSSQPRTLTNEPASPKQYQGGLAPPRSPLNPRTARSIASIRSVIDSGEEDNGSVTGFEVIRKSSKSTIASNPRVPLSPEFLPISRSPSANSEFSINEPLPRPSFNFSRPRSSSGVKLAFDTRPSREPRAIARKPSNGSSLREAVSVSDAENDGFYKADTLSVRAPSRQNSEHGTETRSIRGFSRQNSGNESVSVRGPSRQNSGNDSISVRGPSRQNSGNESVSVRGPSRQNSGQGKNDTFYNSSNLPIRYLPRQDSGSGASETQSVRARSRQNSPHRPQLPRTHSENEVGGGDAMRYRDLRNHGAPSYIYSKYSLPRGRIIERNSAEARNSWIHHQLKWEEAEPAQQSVERVREEVPMGPHSHEALPSLPTTPTKRDSMSSINRSHSVEPPSSTRPKSNHRSTPSSPSITSISTDRTIRGRPHVRNSPSLDIAGISPEQHLEKGIEFHNSGSLSKSTYHLRLAARAGLPTAMLLYALACRHGWGMRPNQAEGVSWLKRAVDSSSLEFMAENDPLSAVAPGDSKGTLTTEQKARKAQFALAIYELGMSYMNGWGIPKDKALALRCFEIAGSWGDNDALAEAGFCYVQGIGCRKDAKKAAGFYRRAADGGMSMAGNSWIWKPKYMEDPIPEPPEPATTKSKASASSGDKAAKAGRSRAKSFFGRKKPPVIT